MKVINFIYSANKIAKQIDKQKLIKIAFEIMRLTQTVKEEKLDEEIGNFLGKLN
jgi:hypothetical protein